MEATTVSLKLSEMSVEQLVQMSQGLGHDIERIREKRAYLKVLIDQGLVAEHRAALMAEAEATLSAVSGRVNAEADGVILEAKVL